MKTIILAAGYATRLYPLTKDKPKALLPTKDGLILDLILAKVANLYTYINKNEKQSKSENDKIENRHEIILVSNEIFYQQFLTYLANAEEKFPNLKFTCINDGSKSPNDRLGAIRDLWLGLKNISKDEDVLVLASDNLFDYELIEPYLMFKETEGHLLTVKKIPNLEEKEYQAFGLAKVDLNNFITRIEEKPKQVFSDNVVFATYFYKPGIIYFVEKMLQDKVEKDSPGLLPVFLHEKGEVLKAYFFKGTCLDIGTKEAYFKLLSTK